MRNKFLAALVRQGDAQGCPCTPVDGTDLVAVPVAVAEDGSDAAVTNDMAKALHLTGSEIMWAAAQNAQKERTVVTSLYEAVGADPAGPNIGALVITNEINRYGAYKILDPVAMREASDRLGGDMYIIPASMHECVLISAADGALISAGNLGGLVSASIDADGPDGLGTGIYGYDMHTGKVCMASDLPAPEDVDYDPEWIAAYDRFVMRYQAYMDMQHGTPDPLAEILDAMGRLQDGEILRIVPAQMGGESNG